MEKILRLDATNNLSAIANITRNTNLVINENVVGANSAASNSDTKKVLNVLPPIS